MFELPNEIKEGLDLFGISYADFLDRCGGKFESNNPNIFLDYFVGHQWRLRNKGKNRSNNKWIRFYPFLMSVGKPCFLAYEATDTVPEGRNPSTVDNRTIGKFLTLGAAIDCITAPNFFSN
jgi:hypothetical protein